MPEDRYMEVAREASQFLVRAGALIPDLKTVSLCRAYLADLLRDEFPDPADLQRQLEQMRKWIKSAGHRQQSCFFTQQCTCGLAELLKETEG